MARREIVEVSDHVLLCPRCGCDDLPKEGLSVVEYVGKQGVYGVVASALTCAKCGAVFMTQSALEEADRVARRFIGS